MNAHELDQLAATLAGRLWYRAVLPGLSLQLVIALALAGALAPAGSGLSAQEPPPVVQPPEPGQPPAPDTVPETAPETAPETVPETPADSAAPPAPEATATEATTEPTSTGEADTTAPVASEPAVAEPPVAEPTVEAQPAAVAEPAVVESETSQPAVAEVTSDQELRVPEVRELSVPPQPKETLLPADAPGWIHETEDLSTSVHRLVVASLPVDTAEEASSPDALDEPLVAAVNHYLGRLQPPVNTRIGVTAEEIRNELLDTKTSYLAPLVSGEVTQFQKYVVLNITPAQRDEFQRRNQALEQRDRMAVLGLSLAAILGLTGVVNRLLTRRSRRYPGQSVPPTTMPLLSAMASYDQNQPPVVRPAAAVLPVIQKKRRSCCSSPKGGVFMVIGIVLLVAWVIPSVKARRHEAQRIEIRHEGFDEMRGLGEDIRERVRQEIQEALGNN